MMKLIRGTGLLLLLIQGCASSSDVDARLRQLKEEMYAEMSNQKGDLQEKLRGEISDLRTEIKRELAVTQAQVAEMKQNQMRFSLDTDKTLIDHQKQIFQIKAVTDDNARRVYMIESVITARGSVAPQQAIEGVVTFIEDKKVAISLGSLQGIKTGDIIDVYKDQDKIGAIEIVIVERDSSRGLVIDSVGEIALGYRVELKKK